MMMTSGDFTLTGFSSDTAIANAANGTFTMSSGEVFGYGESDNGKAANRLASDMGEFFMPFPGTRVNQQTVPLDAAGMTGIASYYEVKFTDKPIAHG